ncbi:MAG: PAS domain-containing protein [Oscillatoriales cyanobacterium RM2_1_1]|nr:PAS domain-containing protein [Oscillatoriales cyanobacterium SM2_3_0]NJO47642.1 PAS domain-containing protein [Oscillatoriales cyanobacterium RM2_1_1]
MARLTNLPTQDTSEQNRIQQWSWPDQLNTDHCSRLQLFATAVPNTGDGIVITTSNLAPPGPVIIYVNRAFTEITGYSPEEVLGQTPRILQGPKTNRRVLNQNGSNWKMTCAGQSILNNYSFIINRLFPLKPSRLQDLKLFLGGIIPSGEPFLQPNLFQ